MELKSPLWKTYTGNNAGLVDFVHEGVLYKGMSFKAGHGLEEVAIKKRNLFIATTKRFIQKTGPATTSPTCSDANC